jgi:hypothetical protein
MNSTTFIRLSFGVFAPDGSDGKHRPDGPRHFVGRRARHARRRIGRRYVTAGQRPADAIATDSAIFGERSS